MIRIFLITFLVVGGVIWFVVDQSAPEGTDTKTEGTKNTESEDTSEKDEVDTAQTSEDEDKDAEEKTAPEEPTMKDEETPTDTEETTTTEEGKEMNTNENASNEDENTTAEEDTTASVSASVATSTVPEEPTTPATPPAPATVTTPTETPEPPSGKVSQIKIFLYEWGIDISEKQFPTGMIIFEVHNSGEFSHEFAIKGGSNFGKVRPGDTQYYSANLLPGIYEIYSPKTVDMERGMIESFQVLP